MVFLRAHFDGNRVVLDEPAKLHAGQRLRVTVEPPADDPSPPLPPALPRLRGIAKGMFQVGDGFNDPLPEFAEYRQ